MAPRKHLRLDRLLGRRGAGFAARPALHRSRRRTRRVQRQRSLCLRSARSEMASPHRSRPGHPRHGIHRSQQVALRHAHLRWRRVPAAAGRSVCGHRRVEYAANLRARSGPPAALGDLRRSRNRAHRGLLCVRPDRAASLAQHADHGRQAQPVGSAIAPLDAAAGKLAGTQLLRNGGHRFPSPLAGRLRPRQAEGHAPGRDPRAS